MAVHIMKQGSIKSDRRIYGEVTCGATGRQRTLQGTAYPKSADCRKCIGKYNKLTDAQKAQYAIEREEAHEKTRVFEKRLSELQNGSAEYMGWKIKVFYVGSYRYHGFATKPGYKQVQSDVIDSIDSATIETLIRSAEFERLQGVSLEEYLFEKLKKES